MTNTEALTLALTLAIQAPDEDKAAELSLLVDDIAASMTKEQMESCKLAAQAACELL